MPAQVRKRIVNTIFFWHTLSHQVEMMLENIRIITISSAQRLPLAKKMTTFSPFTRKQSII